jgi:hypothetical protein
MKKTISAAIVVALSVFWAGAQQTGFLPGHLAALRAGDGELDLHLKQSPIFIDQFDEDGGNQTPSFTVAIPTNGPDTLFFNGHAATEGNLSRSADHKLLGFAGYTGVNLLQMKGAPSLLDIKRAFCTVDPAGAIHTTVYKGLGAVEKMNPRGVVTDGSNNFWGCGNAFGTVYYNPGSSSGAVEFKAMPSSHNIKIVDRMICATLNGADSTASDSLPGIYSFSDRHGNDVAFPREEDAAPKLQVGSAAPYTKIAGFDMSPGGTTAYIADTTAGIQKYVKAGGVWKFAYNFSIPQNIPAAQNHEAGCFGLVVDFSGHAPVIYATTTEGYGGCVNSNRVVRIVDTNAMATVITLAQAPSARIAYRGIDFTPENSPARH